MNIRLATIGDYVQSVSTWNPASEPDETFVYVDLSAVSQSEKRIASGASVIGSDAPSRARQLIRTGDILVSTVRPNLNGVAAVTDEFDGATASTGFCVLRPRSEKLSSRYLMHWVRSPQFVEQMTRQATGASYPAVTDRIVKASLIPLPPLDEQQRIAAILDKADALRRKRKRGLELFDDLLTSIFVNTFGDPVENSRKNEIVQVGEVTTCIVPGRDKPKSFTGTIPWITTGELIPLGHTTSECAKLHLSEREIAVVGARTIPAGSVVMTCVGELGLTSIAADPMVINQQLHSFQCSDKLTPEYLMYALAYQREYMLRRATQTTLPYMNKTVCNSIPIQLPPLELQKKFTDRFHQIKRSAKITTLSEQRIAEFFSSLQHRAFSGQL